MDNANLELRLKDVELRLDIMSNDGGIESSEFAFKKYRELAAEATYLRGQLGYSTKSAE